MYLFICLFIYFILQPSQVSAQQSISTMLVFARVSAVQIVIVRETRSAVVMAVVASVVLQYNKVNLYSIVQG